MQVRTPRVILQPDDVAFLFLVCHAVHQQKLLTALNVGVELEKTSIGAYFERMCVLVEGLRGRIVAVDKKRNVDAGACAFAALRSRRESRGHTPRLIRFAMIQQIPHKTHMPPRTRKQGR